MSAIRKHTIRLRGKFTAVSMEQEFWDAFRALAQERRISVGELLQEIDDQTRGDRGGLSGAVRLTVFLHHKTLSESKGSHA